MAQCRKRNVTGAVMLLMATGLVLGSLVGGSGFASPADADGPSPAVQSSPSRPDLGQGAGILRVKLGDLAGAPAMGPEAAPVTVVAFIDYECPYCVSAHETLEQVMRNYGEKVRVVFKQNPLGFHSHAKLAAQAAVSAMEMDPEKFPALHRLLVKNHEKLELEDLLEYGRAVGLEASTFEEALRSEVFADLVDADRALASRIGISATPFFFVNGRPLRGAKPFASFAQLIDEELRGTSRPTRWVAHLESPRAAGASPPDRARQTRGTDPGDRAIDAVLLRQLAEVRQELRRVRAELVLLRRRVADLEVGVLEEGTPGPSSAPTTVVLDDDPVLGAPEATVGIIAFSDYQDPRCRSFALKTLPALTKAYIDSGKLQFVFRDFPLRRHPEAKGAAVAANCAGKQDAYWRMHDALFAHSGPFDAALYRDLAKGLGLDSRAFMECVAGVEEYVEIEEDISYANSLGIRSTPVLFVGRVVAGQLVDARRLRGTQDFESLSQIIESFLQ